MREKSFFKFVITGGPCAGKTSAVKTVKSFFENRGFNVVIIPETATELICSGIAPWTMDSKVNYQKYQMKMQLEKERLYCEAAEHLMKSGRLIVLVDRGCMDNKAYLTDGEFDGILCDIGLCEKDILDRYDAVFHLESTAKNTEWYTLSNNSARTESPEQAQCLDERTSYVWGKHPYYRMIRCADTFEEKTNMLIDEIMHFVSE